MIGKIMVDLKKKGTDFIDDFKERRTAWTSRKPEN